MTNPYPIPKRYLDGARMRQELVLEPRCTQWALDWKGASGAILAGPTECGKSTCAALAATRNSKSEGWVRWVRADELSRLLSERGGVEQVERIKLARVLVLDELGYERFPELLLEVIGSRYDCERPTIVTSGLRLDAIATRYGDATIRKVVEVGKGTVVDCWAPRAVKAGAK